LLREEFRLDFISFVNMSAVESEIAATAGSPVKKVAMTSAATSEPIEENGDAPSPQKTDEK
jgi:hypothetical protein